MAIDAYTGLPGHGKSYGVVEHVIIPSLKQNRHVVTNIPLDIDALLMDFGGTVEQLPEDWFERPDLAELAPSGCVLVLDELWRRWPNGMKASEALLTDKALLAEHRHRVDKQGRSMRVVLVTQDLAQIASWVRQLVETTYRMVKKSKKLFRVDIYRGAVTGPRPSQAALTRQTAGKFRAEVYRYYQSATQSQSGAVGDESTADGRASILKSWGLWALIGIVVFGGFFGVRGVSQFFSPPTVQQPVAAKPKPEPPPQAPPPTQAAPMQRAIAEVIPKPEPQVTMSAVWRVGGYLLRDQSDVTNQVILISDTGRTRIIPFEQCQWINSIQVDVYCDLDGERVTPWSGRGAVTKVIDPVTNTGAAGNQRSAMNGGPGASEGAHQKSL
ncbi:zona occludens toxin [Azomonas agilis]|uniref:Zona occludens toxin n=1 Tax=Azomonas agilis TaxID=116849 RepID=A0A562IKP0_9GAMM|nr:zonular occludens toxin domain-containing protein [Azomonas agilis]TWH71295.1 zona occludens toxin [Azomonas agilis]